MSSHNIHSNNSEKLQQRIKTLRSEHHELDHTLKKMARAKSVDQLTVNQLKKRKLLLKDTIHKLENQLSEDN